MMSGVYYSLVKNFQGYPRDVTIDIELLDDSGYPIAKADVSFSREQCNATTTYAIRREPAEVFVSGRPSIFPRPVRDAKSVRVTPKWISRNADMCRGN